MSEELELSQDALGEALRADTLTLMEDDDPILTPNVVLETRDDMTLAKVYTALKSNYDNFSFDIHENYGTRFSRIDDALSYLMRSIGDVRDNQEKTEATIRRRRGAAMARFWCICKVLDDIIGNGKKYGSGTVEKLAANLHMSKAYVYQLRSIAQRLSIEDVYLLGTREVGSGYLRNLASIVDDKARDTIINEFIETYRDTLDKKARDKAKKVFVAAVNATGKNAKEIDDANPIAAIQADAEFEPTPECEAIRKSMQSLDKMVSKLAKEDTFNDFNQYAGNFFLMENVPDAEKQLNKVHEEAEALHSKLALVKSNIEMVMNELTSLCAVQLLPAEQ